MPYLGYLLAQALKAGDTIAQAITSASNFVTKVGGSVVDLSPSVEALKSPSDGSASFNGSSEYILIKSNGNNSAFDAQEFTIGAWVYVDVLSGYNPIIWSYDYINHTPPYYSQNFRIEADGALFFGFNIGGTYDYIITSAGTIQTKKWYYVSATFKSGSQKLYVDGNELSSNTLSGLVTHYDQSVKIGLSNYGSYMFGNLSNVAFWSRALSASEIRSVMSKSYDDLNASETKGLVSWYALDDITGTTVPDSHGNYNGTAN